MVGIVNGYVHFRLLSINALWFVMGSWKQFGIPGWVSDCATNLMNGTVHRHEANMVAAVPFLFMVSGKFSRYLVLLIVSNYLSRCFKVIVRRQSYFLTY